MKSTAFSPSPAVKKQLSRQREKTLQFLGQSKYQQIVVNYFPMIRQTMIERNCCAISAACALLLESNSNDPLEKNLVVCAGYDLAFAS